jgi:hypothetical protein
MIEFSGSAEGQRVNQAMAVEQKQPAERRMHVHGVDHHHMAGHLQRGALAAEGEQVGQRTGAFVLRAKRRGIPVQQVHDREVFSRRFQEGRVRR